MPSPLYTAMRDGLLVRFEEITRCAPEVQDVLISLLSEKMLVVPELEGPKRLLFARPGFNVIATANIRDRGVHEMSSALKRRFNFETVQPIRDLKLEVSLVQRETERLLGDSGARVEVSRDVVELLVTAFHDLREGVTAEGVQLEKPAAVMSTAEAISVALSAGLDAFYYGEQRLTPECLCRHIGSALAKDGASDAQKLTHYFDVVVQQRSKKEGGLWASLLKGRRWLPKA